ncbi:MAG TPA: response regulator, partial [Bryobacteraceae bacterium]|nr:response regulator [Bryobacteraceae bacterium]
AVRRAALGGFGSRSWVSEPVPSTHSAPSGCEVFVAAAAVKVRLSSLPPARMAQNIAAATFWMVRRAREESPDSAAPAPHDPSSRHKHSKLKIFLAEDNRGDVLLVREALELGGFTFDLTVRVDGEQASVYFEQIEQGAVPVPDLVLLDLNLPKRTGEILLAHIRQSSVLRDVPVVVVTSSDAPRDRQMVARLGASAYFRKPSSYDDFMQLGSVVRALINPK